MNIDRFCFVVVSVLLVAFVTTTFFRQRELARLADEAASAGYALGVNQALEAISLHDLELSLTSPTLAMTWGERADVVRARLGVEATDAANFKAAIKAKRTAILGG